ncbi:MAG: N-acetylglucosamine-6-phosphate deacetylase [Bacteroidales bacterium]|nr:N-acetylglucosamine-6-phosphate deacetylase [Bacteroidales bacterium]
MKEGKTAIIGGRVLTPGGESRKALVYEDGIILGLADEAPSDAEEVIDASGCFVSPGFIDIHTHGAGGADFMDGTVEAYLTAARMHAVHGTTLLYPTTLTCSNEVLFRSFDVYRDACKANTEGASFGGIHLEGPYFSPAQAGAQDPRYLRSPRPEDYCSILDRCPDIARWSFSPELEGAPAFAAELARRGVLASIGHTNATFEECDAAFKAGARHMTHFFSCMSTITRRNGYRTAGVLEYGYYQEGMSLEIIGDGIHVPSPLLHMILRIRGVDSIALVTDSMRAAGMPDGIYKLGDLETGQDVIVEDGVAKLPDRSAFAGSVATTDRLVRTLIRDGGCSLQESVRMATANPARFMGIQDRKGSLESRKDADIVIFDDNINIKRTIIKGKTIYQCR